MDKEQATDYIINALQQNRTQEEIVTTLSQRLKAPPELVTRFVNQVKTKHAQLIHPPHPIQLDEPPPSQPVESSSTSLEGSEPIPPAASTIAETTPDSIEPSAYQPEVQQTTSPYHASDEIEQATFEESKLAGVEPDDTLPVEEGEIRPTKQVDIEELTAYVVNALGKHRRHSDVVGEVCQRTGWHWKQAQRFVARTKTDQHVELDKKQNRMLIPIGIAFVLGGLFLLIYTGMELLNYMLIPMGVSEEEMLRIDFIPYLVALFFLGFGLLVGGGFGLYRTITSR